MPELAGRPRPAASAVSAVQRFVMLGPGLEAPASADNPVPFANPAPFRSDQAAGLRRLFARASLRVLPVLMRPVVDPHAALGLARLAQSLAQGGERTLVIDAARAQMATALNLRARFDLQHVFNGDCPLDTALLEAEPDLHVLPAARAFDTAAAEKRAPYFVQLLRSVLEAREFDLLLLVIRAEHACLLAQQHGFSFDCLVPVSGNAASVAAALADIGCVHEQAETKVFRLLFQGMPPDNAASLCQRMAASAARRWPVQLLPAGMAYGGHVTRDFAQVARASCGWNLLRLSLPPQGRQAAV